MSIQFNSAIGATFIDQDQIKGLIPKHLIFQHELDEWENRNIRDARRWLNTIATGQDIWTVSFIVELHKQMFGTTWEWSGQFRKSQTNIGVEPYKIVNELGTLLGDLNFWIENKTFTADECCARLHHRLVQIHPFPNGNGRMSRLYADISLMRIGSSPFSWGKKDLINSTYERKQYIEALRAADRNDYGLLMDFVRQG